MSENTLGASTAELAQPQDGATEPCPSAVRTPILAFYSQDEVDRFMGKRLGESRKIQEAYEQLQPMLVHLRKEYGCDNDRDLVGQVLGEAKASGLRYGIGATTPADWAALMQEHPDIDPIEVTDDPKVRRAMRAGFSLSEAVKIARLLNEGAIRPDENGTARHRSRIRLDIERMTDAQLNEVARRVRRGELVQF